MELHLHSCILLWHDIYIQIEVLWDVTPRLLLGICGEHSTLEMSVSTYQLMQHNIPVELYLHQHYYENLKSEKENIVNKCFL